MLRRCCFMKLAERAILGFRGFCTRRRKGGWGHKRGRGGKKGKRCWGAFVADPQLGYIVYSVNIFAICIAFHYDSRCCSLAKDFCKRLSVDLTGFGYQQCSWVWKWQNQGPIQDVLWILFFPGLLDGQRNAKLLGRTVRSWRILQSRKKAQRFNLHDLAWLLWLVEWAASQIWETPEQKRATEALSWGPTMDFCTNQVRGLGRQHGQTRQQSWLPGPQNVDPVLPSQSDHGLVFWQGDRFFGCKVYWMWTSWRVVLFGCECGQSFKDASNLRLWIH